MIAYSLSVVRFQLFLLLRNKNIDLYGLALAAKAATGRLAKKIAFAALRLFFIALFLLFCQKRVQ
ncbi:MAG: hypothetical protein Q4G07_05665 [Oscillospiraceae bacterium]|nr:hypothetical protein [Oscillospiraceae bacterium]